MKHNHGADSYDKVFRYIGVGGSQYGEKAWWDRSQVVDIVASKPKMHHPDEKERKLIEESKKNPRRYSNQE